MPRLFPSENGFSLLFLEKLWLLISLAFIRSCLVLVRLQQPTKICYNNFLKQVLKARLLLHSLVHVCFYVAESNPEGVPSRTGLLVGRFEVWDLFLVTVILKLSLCEFGVVRKKHRICILLFLQ